jgi:hypothetical protein
MQVHQSLVGSVVIDIELGREDHGSIPATAIERRLEPLENQKLFMQVHILYDIKHNYLTLYVSNLE